MIAVIEGITEPPKHFRAEKLEAFEKSMGAWRLRYGSLSGTTSHIVAYFGLVRINLGDAWCWFEITGEVSRRMLRPGRNAWRAFIADRPWTLYASCAGEREMNFARFLGFEHIGFDENGYVMRRG